MDEGGLSSLSVLLFVILVYALITLVYTALTNARQARIRELADGGRASAAQALHVLDNLANFALSYQFSQVILAVVATCLSVVNLTPYLLKLNPQMQPVVAYTIVGAGVILLLVALGNVLPSALGAAYADSLALALAGIARLLIIIMLPFVWLMLLFSRLLATVMGEDEIAATVTEEEIMTLVNAGQKEGTIEDEEKAMIFSVLQFGETLVREVMIPRMDIQALEMQTTFDDALGKFVETGHSRIPVYDDKIDSIRGLLYVKDLLPMLHNGHERPTTIVDLVRPAYFVPEDKRADLVLKEMQQSNVHFAVVVDEYGGTAGIVTIENLIEEIIGDIRDEYDVHEEEECVQQGENEYLIDASMDLDDINQLLNLDLPTQKNDTLGGFIYSQLGRIPMVGEVVDEPAHHLTLRIESLDGRRIRKVHVKLHLLALDDEGAAAVDEG